MRLVAAALLVCSIVGPIAAEERAGCPPAGELKFVCDLRNPEDLVLVPGTEWIVASGMAPGSGLHVIDTRAKTVRPLYAAGSANVRGDRASYPQCPVPVHPRLAVLHGLTVKPAPQGRFTIYVVNHGGRESIEVFDLDVSGALPAATWVGCVFMPPGVAATAVAAFSDGSLVATAVTLPGKTLTEAFALKKTGAVFAWNPGEPAFRLLPGTELPASNGIETSPDDREFFVVSSTLRRVFAYARDKPGVALRAAQLADFVPDNLHWGPGDRLITAGVLDNEPSCGGPPRTEEGLRCPRGYVVVSIEPRLMAVRQVARGAATPSFTGTAVGVRAGDEVWLGSFNADRVAYRALP
jgi:hypothetical protein